MSKSWPHNMVAASGKARIDIDTSMSWRDCPRCEGGWSMISRDYNRFSGPLNCVLCMDLELLPPVPFTEI